MPLRIKCPTGHVLIVPDNRVGKELRCPRCDQPFIVPEVDKKLSLKTGKVPTASPSSSSLDLGNLAPATPAPSPPPPTAPVAPSPAIVATSPPEFPTEPRTFPPRKPAAEKTENQPPPKPTAPPSRNQTSTPPTSANSIPATPSAPAATTPAPPPPPAPPPTPPSPSPARPVEPAAALPVVVEEKLPTGEVAAASEQPGWLQAAGLHPSPSPTVDATQPPPVPTAPVPPSTPTPTPPPAPLASGETQISLAPRKLPVKPPVPTPPPVERLTDTAAPPSEAVANNAAAAPPPAPPPPPVPPRAATVETGAEEPPPRHGVIHGRDKLLVVYQLAAAMIAAGLFSMIPAAWDVLEHLTIPESQHVARWAFLLLMLGLVQIAYCVYLIQLPDWSTVWVITLYALAMAALYAMVFGLTLIASTNGVVVRALQLGDKIAGGQAALWCLCMASLFTLLAFFAGRMSVRWHRAELVLHSAGLAPGQSR